MNKKVAHLKTTYLELSETFFYSFLSSHQAYEPAVITEAVKNLDVFPAEKILEIEPPSFSDKLFGIASRSFTYHQLATERKYLQAVEKVQPSILHAHFATHGVYMLPVAKKAGLPIVTSFYGFDTSFKGASKTKPRRLPFFPAEYWKMGYKKLFAGGDFFVTFGEKMRETVINLGCPPEKVMDIHSGIDLSLRDFSFNVWDSTNEIRLLMVNRLVEKKGVRYAIEALPEIIAKFPNVRLQIIGDGSRGSDLKRLAQDLKVSNKIEWLGMKPYPVMLDFMKKAHVFLTPSVKTNSGDEEGGINTTVIDALALGLPTIATEESGSQLIIHRETGLMARQKSANDLADKAIRLLSRPDEAERMAKAGRSLIERDFDQSKQTQKLEDLYDRILFSQ